MKLWNEDTRKTLSHIYIKDIPLDLILDYFTYDELAKVKDKDESGTEIETIKQQSIAKAFNLFNELSANATPRIYVKTGERDTVLGRNRDATIRYLSNRYFGRKNITSNLRNVYLKNMSDLEIIADTEYATLSTASTVSLYNQIPDCAVSVQFSPEKNDSVMNKMRNFTELVRKEHLDNVVQQDDDRSSLQAIQAYGEYPTKTLYYQKMLRDEMNRIRGSVLTQVISNPNEEHLYANDGKNEDIKVDPKWEISNFAATALANLMERYYAETESDYINYSLDYYNIKQATMKTKYIDFIVKRCEEINEMIRCESVTDIVVEQAGEDKIEMQNIPVRINGNNYGDLVRIMTYRSTAGKFSLKDFQVLSGEIG